MKEHTIVAITMRAVTVTGSADMRASPTAAITAAAGKIPQGLGLPGRTPCPGFHEPGHGVLHAAVPGAFFKHALNLDQLIGSGSNPQLFRVL